MATRTSTSSAKIKVPITGEPRNVFTKMDDHGMYAGMKRVDGESIHNFRHRVYSAKLRPGAANIQGLTDAIGRTLNLGHEAAINITANRPIKLDVTPQKISISGASDLTEIDIVTVDVDGYWNFSNLYAIASGVNAVSGLTASLVKADLSGIAGVTLEEQSSYVTQLNEQVPGLAAYTLGYYQTGRELQGTVIPASIGFNDDLVYETRVSGIPTRAGEWSVTGNRIRSFAVPQGPVRVSYTYNVLESGMTMSLIANGVKVMNLSDPEVQGMMFIGSGIGATGQNLTDELFSVDRAFWE